MSFVKDEDKIYICNTNEEALFFSVPLTREEAEKVRAEPNVANVIQQDNIDCNDPTGDVLPLKGSTSNISSTSKRGDTASYAVFPKDNTNKDQATAINDLLKTLVANEKDVYCSGSDKRASFIAAPLNAENAKKVEDDPNVSMILPECTSNYPDPTEENVVQQSTMNCYDSSEGFLRQQSSTSENPRVVKRDEPADYGIFLKDSADKGQATAVKDLLKTLVANEDDIYVSDTDRRTFFISALLSSKSAQKVRDDPNVSSIYQACTTDCAGADPTEEAVQHNATISTTPFDTAVGQESKFRLLKRDDGYVNSHNVEPEMVYISLPDGKKVNEYKDFVYDKSAGAGVTIYIIDTGAGLKNNDVNTLDFGKYVNRNKRWIHARSSRSANTDENDMKGVGHGTGVLAKAAGWKHGIAKRSNPVIVRVPSLGDPRAWLDGVRQVYKDWNGVYERNPKTATGVINMSWGHTKVNLGQGGLATEEEQNDWIAELRNALNDCIAIGLLVSFSTVSLATHHEQSSSLQPVAASGNARPGEGDNPPVHQYPQLLAYGLLPDVPDMMVVGGVETDGTLWKRSRVDPDEHIKFIKLHAPAVELRIPHAKGEWRPPAEVHGVSYAAGSVTGLAAYFLGRSSFADELRDDDPVQRVRKLKTLLEDGTSVPRSPNINSLYNLADPRTCLPDVPNGFQNGDSSTSANTVLAIDNCFLTTITPTNPPRGTETPPPKCSCTNGAIAGVGSGVVSGTTYSWCQTGALPSNVPPEATWPPSPPPAASPPSQQPPTVPKASQCVVKDPAREPATCTSSIKFKSAVTPLPDGAWTCLSGKLAGVCLCQVGGENKECHRVK
ncbi:MAG: hypothetical protein Q9212_004248 [Teloschistes hypoglaucus]